MPEISHSNRILPSQEPIGNWNRWSGKFASCYQNQCLFQRAVWISCWNLGHDLNWSNSINYTKCQAGLALGAYQFGNLCRWSLTRIRRKAPQALVLSLLIMDQPHFDFVVHQSSFALQKQLNSKKFKLGTQCAFLPSIANIVMCQRLFWFHHHFLFY